MSSDQTKKNQEYKKEMLATFQEFVIENEKMPLSQVIAKLEKIRVECDRDGYYRIAEDLDDVIICLGYMKSDLNDDFINAQAGALKGKLARLNKQIENGQKELNHLLRFREYAEGVSKFLAAIDTTLETIAKIAAKIVL